MFCEMLATRKDRFVHSIKVPRVYKVSSKILKEISVNGGSLKQLLYNTEHVNKKIVYALLVLALKNYNIVEELLKESKLLKKENKFDPWLARILIVELFFGKKEFKTDCKPVATILSYKNQLSKYLNTEHKYTKAVSKGSKPRYVRVNTLKYTSDEVIKKLRNEGWQITSLPDDYETFLQVVANLESKTFVRDFHLKNVLVFPPGTQFYRHALYLEGAILLQDKMSCMAAHLLDPAPKSTVLDACAAPGMKTTHLSALMKNKGKIYAVEQFADRYQTLCHFIDLAGCKNVTCLNADSLSLSCDDHNWFQSVEYILIDPTCSCSGMVDKIYGKDDDIKLNERLNMLSRFQYKLLKYALTNFPNMKRVVYSTCSVYTQENEQVIEDVLNFVNYSFIKKKNKMKRVFQPKFQVIEVLKETWPTRGSAVYDFGPSCLYSDPARDLTNGFFIAVIEPYQAETDTNMKDATEREVEKKQRKRTAEIKENVQSDKKHKEHKRSHKNKSEEYVQTEIKRKGEEHNKSHNKKKKQTKGHKFDQNIENYI